MLLVDFGGVREFLSVIRYLWLELYTGNTDPKHRRIAVYCKRYDRTHKDQRDYQSFKHDLQA